MKRKEDGRDTELNPKNAKTNQNKPSISMPSWLGKADTRDPRRGRDAGPEKQQ